MTRLRAFVTACFAATLASVGSIAYDRAYGPERVVIEACDQPVRVWP